MSLACPILLHTRRHFPLLAIEALLAADMSTIDVVKESLMSFLVVSSCFMFVSATIFKKTQICFHPHNL
jgi:hypothetical protein